MKPALILAVSLLASLARGQVCPPPTVVRPAPLFVPGSPWALPLPTFENLPEISTWSQDARREVHQRIASARQLGDRQEIGRLLVHLDRVRAHCYQEAVRLDPAIAKIQD